MPSNPNRSSCDDPFRACLTWISPGSPSGPASPAQSPTHNPTQPENICQTPPPAVVPMGNPALPTLEIQPAVKSTIERSNEWGTFVTALKVLEDGVGIFPPLKAAVSELLECTMHVQIAEHNKRDYDELASNLASLVQTLRTHLPESRPTRMPYSIENVSRSIGEQAAHIRRQQHRSRLGQVVNALDNEVDVIKCYQRIEHIFRQLQADISLSVWDLAHEQLVEIRLKDLNPVHEARHNAALSMGFHRQPCTSNTRLEILNAVMDWTRDPDVANIYWMNGMAGTGKTTIAYSLCERLEEAKQLGACFFCSRPLPSCRNVNNIIPTIAYQLARFSNPYRKELCEVLSNKPDISTRELSTQFSELITKPLSKVKEAIPKDLIIVIDGLDECSGERDKEIIFDVWGTQKILDLLLAHAINLPVKFLVTSRPEPGISKRFSASKDTRRFALHDVEASFVQEDIHTYLKHELRNIDNDPNDIELLAIRAGRLFIFAATAVRFIEPNDPAARHKKRLKTLLSERTEPEGEVYWALDELYSTILSQALLGVNRDEKEIRQRVLNAVIGAREPLAVPVLTELTGLQDDEIVQTALLPLQSVLRISADTRVVSTLHASFPDFMLNAERSKRFYCDTKEQNTYMAMRCFEIMRRSLKFNICGIQTSSQLDKDIPDLSSRTKAAISSDLFYACRFWGDHLYSASCTAQLVIMLNGFLRYRLLYWVEVLNLKEWVGYGAGILMQALNSLAESNSSDELRKMIQDSRNFVTAYATNPLSQSTPHIYISALLLASTRSFIRQIYLPRLKAPIHIKGTAFMDRGDAALATWTTRDSVSRLAFSRDGKRLVSGAGDGSAIVWDINTGKRLLGPLQKHQQTEYIYALAFSPDGARIASGSSDSKICVWNSYTGDTQPGLFEGHTGPITGLIFSLDGTRLISSSEDHTIRIWDSLTGTQIGSELTGHTAAVMSIALTSDGQWLVSGSDDHTIRVWDLKTSDTIIGPLEGHTDWVDCVSLSPDDKYIVSSSRDCTIRVWDIEKGETVVGPLTGHTDRVFCVAFSPDGERIVSGSFDRTIRVWSAETGDSIAGPFHGHESVVYSVLFPLDSTQIISCSEDGTICIWNADHSFSSERTEVDVPRNAIESIALSPDGTRLVSGSADCTIRVWDTDDGHMVLGPLTGHTDTVSSVAYTSNGACILSGSFDSTICVWDAQTGLPLVGPLTGHTDQVFSIAASPDGKFVVSGSRDCSIKIWDLQAGAEVAKPPMQHSHWVQSVKFSPDGLYIASGSLDMSVCLWDPETGVLVRTLQHHAHALTCVHFSPDSKRLVSGSFDQTVVMWDVDTGTVLSGPWGGHNEIVWAAALSPDGTMVASGAGDGTICLWDAQKGTAIVPPFRGHADVVKSIAFTPDSKHIISGSYDRTIRFWDLDHIQNTQHEVNSNWVMGQEGWIRDSESGLIMWLPLDLRRILRHPSCTLTIPEGLVELDFGNSIYGDRWRDCYDASTDSDHMDS